MEEINAAKLTKDDVDVRLKWIALFHRYKHQLDLCNYVICSLRKDANDRSSTQALLYHPLLSVYDDLHTTYRVSRFFMALTLKDQSILVNGDINEGLLRLVTSFIV
ncbi:Ferredoxin--nitrite reductase, chloroplastic [Zea mays]|uniref:Ferredoxin--nitrite reductase, chloroplastic n=1 Tax=Zea mays TaxID=4577 RepID=A0A3L6ECS9_MAIZE|nr:Ferredoxin--nitrite reductase, chloroplastic [Zea mays]